MSLARFIRIWRLRIRSFVKKDTLDSELSREFSFHLEQLIEENSARGMSREEAARAARHALGSIALFEEQCRDERRVGWLHDLGRDIRYGGRMLWKSPCLTAVAVVSLALGIGANTATLSAIGGALSGSLPYIEPDRLVVIRTFPLNNPSQMSNASLPDYFAWKDQSVSFELMGVSLANQAEMTLGDDVAEERLVGRTVSVELFPALGIQPMIGRLFSAFDYRAGERARAVVISHSLWQRRFGGDPAVLNKELRLNGRPWTIIGVMPPYFPLFPDAVDYWLPMALERPAENSSRFFMVVARLKDGVTFARAQADMDAIAARQAEEFPNRNRGWGVRLQPLREFLYGWIRTPLLTLQAAVGFVVLIACSNVAGLLLARGAARSPEIAMRRALGAGSGRIVRQLLTESVLIAFLGGALGLLVAHWGLGAVARTAPPPGGSRLPEMTLSGSALALTAATSLLTGLAFGLFPAFASLQQGLRRGRQDFQSTRPPKAAFHVRGVLIAGQLALTFMLLIGFSLMTKSFILLVGRDLNFDPHNLLSFEVRIPQHLYLRAIGVYRDARLFEISPNPALDLQRVHERLRAFQGAVAVAGISHPPVNSLIVPSAGVISEHGNRTSASYFLITSNFFSTMRAPLIRGREFDDRDTNSSKWVAVVNETAARQLWPGEDPVGKQFVLDTVPDERSREVIGVIADIPLRTARTEAQAVIYLSYLQQPRRYGPSGNMFGQMTFVIRTTGDPMSLVAAVRKAVAEVEPDRPIANIATVEGYARARLGDFSRYVLVLGAFAVIATLLSAVGVYGMVAYAVAQQTQEIAIRMALGASVREIVALVGRRALLLVNAGLLCGLAGSLVLTRLIASQLWGVTATDPATYAAVSLLLVLVTLLACFIPVRRAIRLDPSSVLRES